MRHQNPHCIWTQPRLNALQHLIHRHLLSGRIGQPGVAVCDGRHPGLQSQCQAVDGRTQSLLRQMGRQERREICDAVHRMRRTNPDLTWHVALIARPVLVSPSQLQSSGPLLAGCQPFLQGLQQRDGERQQLLDGGCALWAVQAAFKVFGWGQPLVRLWLQSVRLIEQPQGGCSHARHQQHAGQSPELPECLTAHRMQVGHAGFE
ncbi:hypothetical protein [Acidovorax lacteus]|uniref:hypothetical protein n=1 Tax=Acidovorax lacteus TaxID=1924988 RepID=UPI0031EE2884